MSYSLFYLDSKNATGKGKNVRSKNESSADHENLLSGRGAEFKFVQSLVEIFSCEGNNCVTRIY